jgi:hypothetical protein
MDGTSTARTTEHGGDSARRPVPRALAVALWVLATVVAGAVTSWAVGAVGGDGDGPGVLSTADVAAELAALTPAPAASPSVTPSSTPSVTPSGVATPAPTAEPSTAPPADPGPAPAEVARTWDVTGGQVAAACRGTTISLLYATPADGWSVEVKHAGPDDLEVELRRGEDETTVRAACVAGTPEQTTTADDHGGSDGSDPSGGGGSGDD